MAFEWDDAKSRANLEKNGLSFEEASLIFDGPVLSARDDRFAYRKERWITVGAIADIVVIVVVHTDRKGVTRLISARLANRKERQRYYEHLAKPRAGSGTAER